MEQTLFKNLMQDIDLFDEAIRAFEAGELDKKAYKGFSGGFGSYAQRSGGHMLRLRMVGGHMTLEKLKFIADSVEKYHIQRLKLTTCQTVQLHDLPQEAVAPLMRGALEQGIVTRGGGGDFPRSVMVSPLSGVEKGEYFDVRPCAEAVNDYLLQRLRDLKMPRKLKVGFSNSPANVTHVTFRDLGFVAQQDGTFQVFCAGGLGPNPKMGVCVEEHAAPGDVAYYIDAMIRVFTAHGNYENRARARTRYLQDTLGQEGLRDAFRKALEEARREKDLSIHFAQPTISKQADGEAGGARVIEQKQPGLYAVKYHPMGGNLPPEKPRALYDLLRTMPQAEVRIGPDGTLYLINLTGREAERALAATEDGAHTLFEHSVCCIGAAVCQQGVRDSQKLLSAMIETVRPEHFADGVLPQVRISGCPSSCGSHQVGTLGFVGGVKMIDKVAHPAFTLLVDGEENQNEGRFGTAAGVMLEKDIPDFMVALGKAVEASGQTFELWFKEHRDMFDAVAEPFFVR